MDFLKEILMRNFLWTYFEKSYVLPNWRDNIQPFDIENAVLIGCQRGLESNMILKAFNVKHLDVLEVDEYQRKRAEKFLDDEYYGIVNFIDSSLIDAKLGSSHYDVIFDFFYMKSSGMWKGVISKTSRILKPNGYLAFGELFHSNKMQTFSRQLGYDVEKDPLERDSFVKGLANNQLRLFENNNNLGGHGIIGVAKKS